jgi:SAM-dependent methyltransferase
MSELGFFDDRLVLESARYEIAARDDPFDRGRMLATAVGSGRHVLELGCSTGFVSALLKENGCSVVGVEIDPLAADRAATICDRVLIRDLRSQDWNAGLDDKFDVVLMGDVLEHLVSPQSLLKRLPPLLNPGGYIVVSVPNIVHWTIRAKVLLGSFRYQPVGLLDFTHLRFFDLRSARTLIEGSGYEIEEFRPIIGGRFSDYFRTMWNVLAGIRPNLFGYQLLFKARPYLRSD